MAAIEVPDGGDIVGSSIDSAHQDVMQRSQFKLNACVLSTVKFCAELEG